MDQLDAGEKFDQPVATEAELSLEITEELPSEVVSWQELIPQDLQIHKGEAVQVGELRHVHHKVAMLVASGQYKRVEIAKMVGMGVKTISALNENPAFKDLILVYEERFRENLEGSLVTLQDRVEQTTHELIDEFQGQLRDPDVAIPFPILADSTFKMLDRAGVGPVKRVEQRSVSLRLDGSQMAAIREEAARVIFYPSEPDNRVRSTPFVQDDKGSGLGEAGSEGSVGEDEADWIESKGASA